MTAQKTNCLLRLKVTPKENSDAFCNSREHADL